MTIDPDTRTLSLTSEFRANATPSKRKGKASPRLSFRLSDEELAELKAKAGKLSISAYVRKRLFGNHGTRPSVRQSNSTGNSRALAQVLALLGKSDVYRNLNMIAAEARAGSLLLDEQTMKQIDEACRAVSRMRNELVAALDLREGRNQ